MHTSLGVAPKFENLSVEVTPRPDQRFNLSVTLRGALGDASVVTEGIESKRIELLQGETHFINSVARPGDEYLRDICLAFEACSTATRPMVRRQAERTSIPWDLFDRLSKLLDAEIDHRGEDAITSLCKVHEVAPRIVSVWCPYRPILCAMFMRPQEYYESPIVAGQLISRSDYVELYRAQLSHLNQFSYYGDWSGFNSPDYVYRPFAELRAGFPSAGEKALLKLLSPYTSSEAPFYVVGYSGDPTSETAQDTLDHEMRHGLFHTQPKYRADTAAIVSKEKYLNLLPPLFKFFQESGYHPKVWIDEVQAYLGSKTDRVIRIVEFSPEQVPLLEQAREEILAVERRFVPKAA